MEVAITVQKVSAWSLGSAGVLDELSACALLFSGRWVMAHGPVTTSYRQDFGRGMTATDGMLALAPHRSTVSTTRTSSSTSRSVPLT